MPSPRPSENAQTRRLNRKVMSRKIGFPNGHFIYHGAWQRLCIGGTALSGQDIYYGFFRKLSPSVVGFTASLLNHLFCVKISTAGTKAAAAAKALVEMMMALQFFKIATGQMMLLKNGTTEYETF